VDHVVATVAGRVVGARDRRPQALTIVLVDLGDRGRQLDRLIVAPAVVAAESGREVDLVGRVIVLEEPQPGELDHLVEQIDDGGIGQLQGVGHHHLGLRVSPTGTVTTICLRDATFAGLLTRSG
jgi:hypothetical protein